MRRFPWLCAIALWGVFSAGCSVELEGTSPQPEESSSHTSASQPERQTMSGHAEVKSSVLCDGAFISVEAVDKMLALTTVTDHEDIYSTYDRIDAISTLFEDCNDPWGLFPLTYRHITARGIRAIERGEFDERIGATHHRHFAGRYPRISPHSSGPTALGLVTLLLLSRPSRCFYLRRTDRNGRPFNARPST